MKTNKIVSIALRLIASVILLQTLYFKFTGAPESVYIFSAVGIEPWGRIGTGIAELIAAILLLTPATIVLGAFMSIGLMAGAVFTHVFIIGIVVQDDGGLLFAYALLVLVCSLTLLVIHKDQLIAYKQRLFS